MQTVDPDIENNTLEKLYNCSNESDLLIKGDTSALKCNPSLIKSFNVLKKLPMGHKGFFYQRVLNTNGVTSDDRSQSLPSNLPNGTLSNSSCCDTKPEIHQNQLSPTCEWFKTWPERCEKPNASANDLYKENNTQVASNGCDINLGNGTNKVTLDEALQNISLAYDPLTKQLHLVESVAVPENVQKEDINESKKLGHRRTEAGSFSSTVSSLSDPSTSGSLLDAEDRYGLDDDSSYKPKKKGIGHFFGKNVFSWKFGSDVSTNNSALWKLFGKPSESSLHTSPQHVVASSSALIQHARPSNLPAKTEEEEQRHREEYKAILAAAKKREAQYSVAKQKLHKQQLKQEEQQASAAKHFMQVVLPNWDAMRVTRKTKDLWWQGLPSSVRGKVWRLAIGNELNLTPQLYEICLSRAQNRLNSPEPSHCESDIDQESSMDVIQLDISRTFPHLCIFQEGGPYSDILHSLLAAYVCYRPDVGYVQGMSYIAAILILNMEQMDAFVCFANLLNRPLHLAAFTLNQMQMQAYYNAYNEVFNYNLPKLYTHFQRSGLTPDLYLLDWIYTIFAKAMPLDVACRVWDIFLRDGDEFLFRTALGILHLNQDLLIHMDFLHGAQFLTHLPEDLSGEQLFKSIQSVTTSIGKQTFGQIVDRCGNSL